MVIEGGWTKEAQFVSADEIGGRDTPVPCYVVHLLETGMSVRQRMLNLVNNLAEDSEDDDSDDTSITDLTQVADADGLLHKGKLKVKTYALF